MTDFNFLIAHPDLDAEDYRINAEIVMAGEVCVIIEDRTTDIYDLLKRCGIFPSKNEARRNWKRGQIKDGLNDWPHTGKLRHRLFVHRIPDDFRPA